MHLTSCHHEDQSFLQQWRECKTEACRVNQERQQDKVHGLTNASEVLSERENTHEHKINKTNTKTLNNSVQPLIIHLVVFISSVIDQPKKLLLYNKIVKLVSVPFWCDYIIDK